MFAQPEDNLPKQDSAMTSTSQLSLNMEKDSIHFDFPTSRDLDNGDSESAPPHRAHDEEAGVSIPEAHTSDEKPQSDLLDWDCPQDPGLVSMLGKTSRVQPNNLVL